MKEMIKRFLRDEEGATMVEYAIMVALIAVVCILIIAALGTSVSHVFSEINSAINP